jgi:hypothetical protein
VGEGLGEHPRLGAVSRPKATRFMSARMSSPPARAPGTWVETRTGTPSSRKVVPGPVGVAAPEALEGGREELDLGEHRVRLRTVTFLAVMPTADMGPAWGWRAGRPGSRTRAGRRPPAVPMPEGMGQQPFRCEGCCPGLPGAALRHQAMSSINTLGRSLCGIPVVWAFGPFTEAPSAAVSKDTPKYSLC